MLSIQSLRLQHAIKKTNVSEMQKTFERHVSHLPNAVDSHHMINSSKTLAVVGSTGFLGPHIVASLLRKHKHADIFCLNRSLDGKQRTESALYTLNTDCSLEGTQLHFWTTDITQKNLGLTILQVAFLASRVDELVFNAWDPHWGKDISYFDSFLTGIRNTIDVCAASPRHPRIIFISSICAVGNWPMVHPEDPGIPEAVVWDNRSAMPHGYGESKCVAEQILAKAQEVSGLPVSIVRAGQIGGPSKHDMGAWPRQGWLYSVITASIKLKAFPTQVQAVDWIPVDILADGIAEITMRFPSASGVEVFNAVHPDPVPWTLLYKTLQKRFGLEAEEECLPDWLDRFDPARMKLHGFMRAMGDGRERNMSFKNHKALEVLPSVPSITEDLLARWLTDWRLASVGLGAKL
jgi:thioester reductase-like protein